MMENFALFCALLFASVAFSVNAGASCSCSCDTSESNTCGNCPLSSSKSAIKQCVYKNINDDRDSGLIRTCSFVKFSSTTSLRVTFQGVLRVTGCSGGCCRRWFITINDKECASPATIDTLIYADGAVNRHIPGTLDGFCDNIPKGKVTVGISIGKCSTSYTKGDGYTGWETVSRFIIEEVPPLQ